MCGSSGGDFSSNLHKYADFQQHSRDGNKMMLFIITFNTFQIKGLPFDMVE